MTGSALLFRLREMFRKWRRCATQRKLLSEMSDQMLSDIGLSRADAWQEGGRPFWDCAQQYDPSRIQRGNDYRDAATSESNPQLDYNSATISLCRTEHPCESLTRK